MAYFARCISFYAKPPNLVSSVSGKSRRLPQLKGAVLSGPKIWRTLCTYTLAHAGDLAGKTHVPNDLRGL